MGDQVTIEEVLTPEGTTQTIGTMVESAMSVFKTNIPAVWEIITGNVLLGFFVGVSVVSMCFSVFRKAKRIAK